MDDLVSVVELLLGLLAALALLVLLARRLSLPYPILLVVGGLALGFLPGVPCVQLAPNLVFLLFLPPLLYEEAYFTSWRDFRANRARSRSWCSASSWRRHALWRPSRTGRSPGSPGPPRSCWARWWRRRMRSRSCRSCTG